MKFCKHNYAMKINKTIGHIDYDYIDKGIAVKRNTKISCVVYCKNCGKQKKRLANKIRNLYINSIIDEEQENFIKEIITTFELPKEFY